MTTIFIICAVAGSVLLLVQFALSMTGVLGAEMDLDVPDHDASWFFSVLSFQSLVAAVAFFGLGGLAAQQADFGAYVSLVTALGAAVAAMVLVAWLMKLLHGLHSEGNVLIDRAVGLSGVVYLTVPAARRSAGKVTVTVQGRTMEYAAVTAKDELKTGTPVVVVGVVDAGTLEIEPAYDAVEDVRPGE